MSKNFSCIILAAGEGTRMKSEIPKVMHTICGRPMLEYVFDLAKKLKLLKKTFVVVGYKKESLKDLIASYGLKIIHQDKLLGTGDAIKRTQNSLKNASGNVIILYGDQPLLKEEVLKALIDRHLSSGAHATILTARVDSPHGYGRIVRDNFAAIKAIVEERDADEQIRAIKEVNTGIICFKKEYLFKAIEKIRPDNAKKEYYLTDAIKVMADEGLKIESFCIFEDIEQAKGINDRMDLAQAQKVMRLRILNKMMSEGVGIVDPMVTYVEWGVEVGNDSIIYPFTVIEKDVKIGKFCTVGPFCHLRSGTIIEDRAVIGNFTELVRSHIGKDTLMKHFSYLGDSVVGKGVNIGCGTVAANFDGKNKQKSIIGDKAFIGSDTILRAPIKIGKNAITGAGAVVTKNVKDGKIVVGVPAREVVLSKRRTSR